MLGIPRVVALIRNHAPRCSMLDPSLGECWFSG